MDVVNDDIDLDVVDDDNKNLFGMDIDLEVDNDSISKGNNTILNNEIQKMNHSPGKMDDLYFINELEYSRS